MDSKILCDIFAIAWEQRKLGDVFTERTERANGDEELLSVTIGNGVIRQVDSDKRNIASEDKSNYKIVHKGDVPYNSMRMWQGAVGNSEYDGIVSPAYTVLVPSKEANGKFFMELFKKESTLKIFQRWSQGLTSDTWNLKYPVLSTIEISIPRIEEQKRISDYFATLDHLITLHQRKLDHVKDLKKSMLQKMFPKNGQLYPEVRFPEFTDAWEQRKLGELVGIYDGVHQTPEYQDSGIMFLSVENIATLKSEKYISEEAFERDYKVYPEKGDILMTRIGDVGTTNVVETAEKVAFYVSLALLKPNGIDSYFLSNAMKTNIFQKGLRERTLVTAIPQKINKDEIGKIDIFITNDDEEQKKIGTYFSTLDTLITLHQRELDHLKLLKKGMLQQMFV